MKNIQLSLVTILLCIGISSKAQVVIQKHVDKEVTPESLNLIKLTKSDSFPESQRDMMKIIERWLSNKDDITEEYYAIVDDKNSTKEQTQVLLYHETAFPVMTSAQHHGVKIKGNPGGKCKTIYFDNISKEVIKQWWWQ